MMRNFSHIQFIEFFFILKKSFIDHLKRVIVLALENCEAEGKIKILSGIAMVSCQIVVTMK
jgi:hypothetical protein